MPGRRSSTPTMKDIAARANVSIGTVSRVLNRHDDVDRVLRERVELAVRKLGYRMNQRTRAMVHSKSRMIGLIVCNDFGLSSAHALLLLGVEEYCAQAGYYLLFARHQFPRDTPADAVQIPSVVETPGLADCFILAGTLHENLLSAFDRYGLNYVLLRNHLLDPAPGKRRLQSVRFSDETGFYEAARYLAQLGHEHIWYVGDGSRPWHRDRYNGYTRATADLGLETHVHTIALSDDEFENGQMAVTYILEQQWPVTAVLAASDELAFGVREGLRLHRKEVPKDVSLIGFENQAGHSRGSNLTSVCVDMVEVGRQLAKLAIGKIESRNGGGNEVTVPTGLVKRSTCRPLRKEEHMLL
ncbi:MAG TPA: LacI family DNA-binding transcriptional regulator [Bryobacteraceae bacterium]|nr:LacI family DNA-binding transcriptional regulator [Bryobacteraceae bacterium]